MEKLRKIREMVCDELDSIAKRGELSAGSLETLDKLTHTLKSIDTVIAMGDYEGGASYDGADGGAMGGGVSGRRGRSRTTGRYVSRDGGYSGRRYDGGMSYAGARDELMAHVDELMGMADDEPTRAMIRRFQSELEKS